MVISDAAFERSIRTLRFRPRYGRVLFKGGQVLLLVLGVLSDSAPDAWWAIGARALLVAAMLCACVAGAGFLLTTWRALRGEAEAMAPLRYLLGWGLLLLAMGMLLAWGLWVATAAVSVVLLSIWGASAIRSKPLGLLLASATFVALAGAIIGHWPFAMGGAAAVFVVLVTRRRSIADVLEDKPTLSEIIDQVECAPGGG